MYDIMNAFIDKLIEQSTPEAPIWNKEAIRQKKVPRWNYIDGVMLISILELYHETRNETYLKFVHDFVDYYVYDDGTIRGYDVTHYSTDDICASRVLFDVFSLTKENKYNLAIEYTYRHVLRQPRTKEGNFWHKLIYPHQVWLDGLYMVQPFYTRYETLRNNKRNYDDIIHHFKMTRQLMFNSEKKLYFHGFDSSKTAFWANKDTGLSQNFWLRAIGWYTVAIIDVISYLEDDCKDKEDFLHPLFKETIDGILMYQDKETHLFYQVVDQIEKEDNYLETSGSALIAYAILKGVRLNVLPKSYQQIGLNIFNSLVNNRVSIKDELLSLDGICLVAGLGPDGNLRRDGSYEYYISEPVVEDDAKGVAPLIMAYTEVIKCL